jgi:hypothetical protein
VLHKKYIAPQKNRLVPNGLRLKMWYNLYLERMFQCVGVIWIHLILFIAIFSASVIRMLLSQLKDDWNVHFVVITILSASRVLISGRHQSKWIWKIWTKNQPNIHSLSTVIWNRFSYFFLLSIFVSEFFSPVRDDEVLWRAAPEWTK